VHSCEIGKAQNVKPLLFPRERTQLCWFSHVSRIPGEISEASPTHDTHGKKPRGNPLTRWHDYVSNLVWSIFGVDPEERSEIAVDHEIY